MKIPVFVSCPTTLSPAQEAGRKRVLRSLDRLNLEPRALGRSDYPAEFPLREVCVIAKHCSGGVILGFEQIRVTAGVIKPDTKAAKPIESGHISVPSPWNHLEAGILFGLQLPLLIFRESTISGGVFDNGVTDVFVHTIPSNGWGRGDDTALDDVFLRWRSRVGEHYYS
jgi:hypothetical protein